MPIVRNLVEGYFDRLALVAACIENVAAIGTKQLSQTQVEQLKTYLISLGIRNLSRQDLSETLKEERWN